MISAAAASLGVLLTLAPALIWVVTGLALCSSAIFVCQAATASYLGHIAGKSRASAAGLYSSFYYAGGTAGAAVPALAWSLGGWPACVLLNIIILIAVGAPGLYLLAARLDPPRKPPLPPPRQW